VGLLGSNRIGSRRVIQVSAGFMIFFSMLGQWKTTQNVQIYFIISLKIHILLLSSGKFGALFASIPFPMFAAVYCVLFGIVGEYFLNLLSDSFLSFC